ncbi:DUF1178 family protein [Melaminivora alkalimesophila]|uniref:DUF1178 family protein n=1 Tax=Melaminivora alkalimesophila TaxID=1165852 RepID=A0A317RFY7_9BURK|nr:DUF1178 family protein [Melaminivora alkalimesophila]PWW48733.1 hypothetical protein DFR36_101242 [Melaminivora alkalimesophila]
MKVLDLHCPQDHRFEGWFASEAEFQQQLEGGLLQCPLCFSAEIRKGLSAPRLNLRSARRDAGGARHPDAAVATASEAPAAAEARDQALLPGALQAAWLQLARHIVAHTEDVGDRFAHEARRIHHGQAQERGIRGRATPEEAAELLEEGIAVAPLWLPDAAKETLQ